MALGYEYYTEAPASIRPHYPSVSGSLTLIQNLMVRWFVGGQRAGIKCVNGVCRNYPAFTGVRLEVVASEVLEVYAVFNRRVSWQGRAVPKAVTRSLVS